LKFILEFPFAITKLPWKSPFPQQNRDEVVRRVSCISIAKESGLFTIARNLRIMTTSKAPKQLVIAISFGVFCDSNRGDNLFSRRK